MQARSCPLALTPGFEGNKKMLAQISSRLVPAEGLRSLVTLSLAASLMAIAAAAQTSDPTAPPAAAEGHELPVHRIPNIGAGAEFYFSPDGTHIIGDAKGEGDTRYQVYTLAIDGTDIRRINDKGDDACSFYFPDGKRIIWTSSKDHPELANSNYSNPSDYPRGAEIYSSKLDGTDVKRLTNNNVYDAEVSVAPNGKWILFGSERSGKMELWKADIDGSNPVQITHLDGWEPGGSFLFRDGKTIIFRAWRSEDAKANKKGLPMDLFTIQADGTGLKQLTHDGGTNWSPFPAPDGHHYVFVKVLPPHNYEIFLGDLNSDQQVRLTYNDAFEGYPSLSPNGHWLLFTSTRDSTPAAHTTGIYLMDISSLHIGPQ
jgi:Tol biopolymer transport system component